MSNRIAELKQELEASRAHLNTVLDQVNDQWETQVYSEGAQWNVLQLLIHLMVTEESHRRMVAAYAEGQPFVSDDFDLQRYNRRSVEKNAETTPEQARASMAASRAKLYEWMAAVDDAKLKNEGRHGSGSVMTVERILQTVAWHERTHADDIARTLLLEV